MLKLEDKIDRGDLHLRDTVIDGITAVGCGLSVHEEKRSTFDDCRFSKITAKKCVMGYPIFRRCTFNTVKSDFLGCYGTLFLECKLEGIIDGVNFALTPIARPISEKGRQRLTDANLSLASEVKWSLDVRNAILAGAGFNDEAIVPKVLFNRGQCLIYRGTDLQEKLIRAFKSVQDRGIQRALVPPPNRKATVHLVTLEAEGAMDRIEEIKQIVLESGLEVIEEPLCG